MPRPREPLPSPLDGIREAIERGKVGHARPEAEAPGGEASNPPPNSGPVEYQQASMPVSQQVSMPALIKATFYLSEDDIMQLERIRLARRSRGVKMDKSALIREAIKLLQP